MSSVTRIGFGAWLAAGAGLIALLPLAVVPAAAEPSTERTLVHAVADQDQNRILIRWMQVEGTVKRYAYFDVLRRSAAQTSFTQMNPEPIGALTTAAAIQTLFSLPDNTDALAKIQATLGADYANALLAMQNPTGSDMEPMQLRLLPDLNYGAAVALGLGYLDDAVVPQTTYVYEVWGLDAQGFRVERLGRASATAGAPVALSAPPAVACVDPGDESGDMAAFLRWDEAPSVSQEYVVGYDLLRSTKPANGPCPVAPMALGQAGVVKANQFPTLHDAPGDPPGGKKLFAAGCATAGCHTAADPRAVAPPLGVKDTNVALFRRRQNPALWPNGPPGAAVHDTTPLNNLSSDEIRKIFDWIQEFQQRDDGADTPFDPLVAGETYCYQVMPRNLLGEYGLASPTAACVVRDRRPPAIPYAIRSERVTQGGGTHETCRISWLRTVAAGDDTLTYELARSNGMPRIGDPVLPAGWPQSMAQPATGERVQFDDLSVGPAQAGQTFFYAARALDAAGNRSDYSAWVPCVPRDIVAPPPSTVTLSCCRDARPEECQDRGLDTRWVSEGGDRVIIADPGRCQVQIDCSHPNDTFGCRLYRSFDDQTYAAGKDFAAQQAPFDFEPLIDSKVFIKTRPYDRSFNLGPLSQPAGFILKGKNALPAPHIVQVSITGPSNEFIRIRFRSLKPEALLGFALYERTQDPDEPAPQTPVYDLVTSQHPTNLSAVPNGTQWTVKAGARTLDTLNIGCPASLSQTMPFFCYDGGSDLYYLQVAEDEPTNLVLKLVAIGWTGQEGLSVPYVWDGWQPGDGVLDWPYFRTDNYRFIGPEATLNAAYSVVNNQPGVDLTWTAYPDACADSNNGPNGPNGPRPFVVFRRRGSSPRWQQISPPFICDSGNPALLYRDTDIQPGFAYTYTVIRLTANGEFGFRFGPQGLQAP